MLACGVNTAFWHKLRHGLADRIGVSLVHAQEVYAGVLEAYVPSKGRWLDVGCGRQVVPSWAMPADRQAELVNRTHSLTGIDVDSAIREHPLLTNAVVAIGDHMPFKGECFDLVTANMVIEHVRQPDTFLAEIKRVLRPSGRFIFHTPNRYFYLLWLASLVPDSIKKPVVQFLEQRSAPDVFPTFYRMNTVRAIQTVCSKAGFIVEKLDLLPPTGSFAAFGAIGVLEIFMLRICTMKALRSLRSNFIVVVRRPDGSIQRG